MKLEAACRLEGKRDSGAMASAWSPALSRSNLTQGRVRDARSSLSFVGVNVRLVPLPCAASSSRKHGDRTLTTW